MKADHACSACQRRKLRCDREMGPRGCSTCKKFDVPCIYTDQRNESGNSTTRAGRKKIRGPYRKTQTPREKELENCVQLLTKKCSELESQLQISTKNHDSNILDVSQDERLTECLPRHILSEPGSSLNSPALSTRCYVPPEPAVILELWLRFESAVDPFTKIIHCPTVSHIILGAKDFPFRQPPDIEALMLSIYIVSLNSLEETEIPARLGGDKEDLTLTYQMALEHRLLEADADGNLLTLTLLQAALIYLGSLRRRSGDDQSLNIGALLELILRIAHHLRLADPASYSPLNPYEAEYRRRAWWTLGRYRSAYAEDLKQDGIAFDISAISLPSNYNDCDLEPSITIYPAPREELTEMSIMLMQFKVLKLLTRLKVMDSSTTYSKSDVKDRGSQLILDAKAEIEQGILSKCDASRPFDWLILLSGKVILSKVEITLLEYSHEANSRLTLDAFHDSKILLALDIIESHHLLLGDDRHLRRWRWFWQYSHQWHSTIYVLRELTRRPEASFANRAWNAINLVFTTPRILEKHGMNTDTRNELLESHDSALKAREGLMRSRARPGHPTSMSN